MNIINLNAQSYEDMWKKVEALQYDDKPKSVIDEAQKIYDKAVREQNFAQLLKARICITEKKCDLDPELFECDEYEKLITEIEQDRKLDRKEVTARLALTRLMLASAYQEMRYSAVHDFDQETQEQFPAKAREHALKAIEDMESLSETDCRGYVPLIKIQEDSHLYNHDLLSVTLRALTQDHFGGLSEEEQTDLISKAVNVYRKKGNKEAVALLTMQELRIRHNTSVKSIRITDERYRTALKQLLDESMECETGIDIAIELANNYNGNQDDQLAFVRWGMEKWAGNERVGQLKNVENSIMASSLSMRADDKCFSGLPFSLTLEYRNTERATLTVREYAGLDREGNLSEKGKVVLTRNYDLPLDVGNQFRKTKNLPTRGTETDTLTLPVGHYVLVAGIEGDKRVIDVNITSLRALAIGLPDSKSVRIMVLDNTTGRPVPGATVLAFKNWNHDYNKRPDRRLKTDSKGMVNIADYKSAGLQTWLAVRDESRLGTPSEDHTGFFYPSTNYQSGKEKKNVLSAFTDRSIYRPGQTVHGNVIEYWQHADTVKALNGKTVKVEISDPDYKQVFKGEFMTNELGSASFDFDLPEECKLGNYQLRVKDGRYSGFSSFHVEEYKRPTFEVVFDEKQKDIKHSLGETICVNGSAMMFSGAPNQGARVEYTIEWAENHRWLYYRNWQVLDKGETETADDGTFSVNMGTELPEVVYTDSISFRVKAEITDLAGEMQSGVFTFNVKNPDYDESKEKKNDEVREEIKSDIDYISETQDAVITFRPKEKDALVYYIVASEKKVEMEGSRQLDGDEFRLSIKYRKEWGDGVTVNVFYVRNGHKFSSSKHLPYVLPEKKLTLAWKTFRDNLVPGQKERWTLTVKDYKGRTVQGAELMAVMYDASLDNIYPHIWDFGVNFDRITPYIPTIFSNYSDMLDIHLFRDYKSHSYYARMFDYLAEFEHQRWLMPRKQNIVYGKVSQHRVMKSAGNMVESAPMMSYDMVVGAVREEVASEPELQIINGEDNASASQSMRTNLSELAFFHPHLVTDGNGEAHIEFTLPDCLTEWKFMGIVHTSDLDYGKITATATAKKDFMVQPNMPRFLRTGDKATISAKIVNLCDKTVKGTATLRILNAGTEKEVCVRTTEFCVESNQSAPVSFSLDADMEAGDYICEIMATDGTATDGEQNRLPVLSTRVDVVENVPFYLDGASTKEVDLSALFNKDSKTATDKHIEVGYTDNPALPVFQSLKALQLPEHDNAPCFAAALYSNLVMLDMSTVLGDRLTGFDPAKAQGNADKALGRLRKLQRADGAWSWFEGMGASPYITLSVAESLSRLQAYLNRHDEKCPKEVGGMLRKALKYLDAQELKEFKERKKYKMPLRPYDTDIRYLAICTDPDKEMLNTYLDELIKDFRQLTIYGRSESVLILKKYGREKQAQRFLESVKEYTVSKEGFGRYFATDLAYYSWMDYRIPTQLAAMRGITAYESLNTEENHKYLLDMQLWLLRQKQTHVWENPINALDVADFLLTNNREEYLHEVTTPALVLDGTSVVQDSVYNINKVKKLSVTKTSPGISWGHVRGTFREEVTNLDNYSSGELTIERKVIRNGNKVTIRHILHADRDMDFVTVKSQHAACLEPLRSVSGFQWMGGRPCYLEVHDSYINLFFEKFTRGTTTIDMDYYIARDGEYNSGYASIECSYAKEFGAHTKGEIFR